MENLFESYERRIDRINAALAKYGINGIEGAKALCDAKGIDPYKMCEQTQPICFENAKWAYVVGAAIAVKKGCKTAAEAPKPSAKGCRRSASPDRWPTTVRWVSVTAIIRIIFEISNS